MKIKKTVGIVILLLILGYPLAVLFAHITNIVCSKAMETDISKYSNNANDIVIAEVKTSHGKLVGNGNGIQYRCDILVKGEPTDSVINAVQELNNKYFTAEIVVAQSNKISIRHSNALLSFSDKDFNELNGKGYYIIYVFDDSLEPFWGELDWCGH